MLRTLSDSDEMAVIALHRSTVRTQPDETWGNGELVLVSPHSTFFGHLSFRQLGSTPMAERFSAR